MKTSTFLLTLTTALMMLCSCSQHLVRVKPYERGNLANPLMADDTDTLQKPMSEHVYFSREGSYGGGGVGGGGCGCN